MTLKQLSGPVSYTVFEVGPRKVPVHLFGDSHFSVRGQCNPCSPADGCHHVSDWLQSTFVRADRQYDLFLEINWAFRKGRTQTSHHAPHRYLPENQIPPLERIRIEFDRCFLHEKTAACNRRYPTTRFHYSDPRWDDGRLFALTIGSIVHVGASVGLSSLAAVPGLAYAAGQTFGLFRHVLTDKPDPDGPWQQDPRFRAGLKIAGGLLAAWGGQRLVMWLLDRPFAAGMPATLELTDAVVLSDDFETDAARPLQAVGRQMERYNGRTGVPRAKATTFPEEMIVREGGRTYHKVRKQLLMLPDDLRTSVENHWRVVSRTIANEGKLPYDAPNTVPWTQSWAVFTLCASIMNVYTIARMLRALSGFSGWQPSEWSALYAGELHAAEVVFYFENFYPQAKRKIVSRPMRSLHDRCVVVRR